MAQVPDILTMGTASGVRIYATRTTNLTRIVTERHKCSHVASAALGRAMAGALLFAATMKEGERVGLRFKGDGPIGEVVADAENFCVRGYVGHPDIYLPPKN
ncbi:MAG: Hsp33 family molecular chaperone HslO, partial [Acidaminococcaceae bacterium]|nr:Hsp33 family molecular chaperone HslO [Acidaminococcaceae bacterium]